MNGHAPENGRLPSAGKRANGYAPEKGASERACSGILLILLLFFVFASCFAPVFRANGHEKRVFKWINKQARYNEYIAGENRKHTILQ